MEFCLKKEWRRNVASSLFLSLLIYLYIVVRNAVRKSDTFFIQSTKNQHLGHSKRSAKCGAKIEKEPDNAPWV